MTLVETLIAGLVSLTVLGLAWELFTSTQKQGGKAQAYAAAIQAGAQLLYTLQEDMANIVPEDSANDTLVVVSNEALGNHALTFKRRGKPIDYSGNQYPPADTVTYIADKNFVTSNYTIRRSVLRADGTTLMTQFTGVFAQRLRFGRIDHHGTGPYFLRVSLLLLTEDLSQDTLKNQSASVRAKPFFLSTIFRIPVKGIDPSP